MTEQDNNKAELRSGFTTGACAAAAALAAVKVLYGESPENFVEVLFPDRQSRRIQINNVRFTEGCLAVAEVVKDAGDDPDITDGAVITVSVKQVDKNAVQEADFIEKCGSAELILRGGEGVGRVARKGLPVAPGKWAINPGPRKMMRKNLSLTPLAEKGGRWLVDISIANGASLAQRTLNPVLGVEGGLSVLGSSGIVVPCSNAAYIDTIRALVKGAAVAGCGHLVFVTGGRTHRIAQELYPDVKDLAIVRIGDFAGDAVEIAASHKIGWISVVCMPGKLAKYACGLQYTHAHVNPASMPVVAELLRSQGWSEEVVETCDKSCSMREFLELQSNDLKKCIMNGLAEMALVNLKKWSEGIVFDLTVVDSAGESLARVS